MHVHRHRPRFPQRPLVALLAALTVASCGALGFNQPVELPPPSVNETASGTIWVDLEPGVGARVAVGDRVRLHYTASLDGGGEFDSSEERGIPVEVEVGAGDVVKGWDEGLVGMQPNGRRRLWIPAEAAYGAEGLGDAVPPDRALVIFVELVAIL